VVSAKDPKYTVVPQRERLERGLRASASVPGDEAVVGVDGDDPISRARPGGP
jgi:hypothetical protein